MKRLVSILLAAVLILSLAVIHVSAGEAGDETPDVIAQYQPCSPALIERMEKVPDEKKIGVWVWLYDDLGEDRITALIAEEYGADFILTASQEEYRKARINVIAGYYGIRNREIVDSLGVDEGDISFLSTLTPSFILRLTKAQINALCMMDEVCSIDLYENSIYISEEDAQKCRFLNAFENWIASKTVGGVVFDIIAYRELYTQYDDEGNALWAIIYAPDNVEYPWEARCGGIVGGRLISVIGGGGLFETGWCLYDLRDGEFYDLTRVSADKYVGLAEALDELDLGNPVGDLDFDKEITIVDATKMQRILAELDSFNDYISGFRNEDYADFDRDGAFTILDATAIQRSLAGLEPVDN